MWSQWDGQEISNLLLYVSFLYDVQKLDSKAPCSQMKSVCTPRAASFKARHILTPLRLDPQVVSFTVLFTVSACSTF